MPACSIAQSCLALCQPVDGSPPGSSVHGASQARILECTALPFPGGLPDPGIKPASLVSLALAGRFFTTELPGKPTHTADPGTNQGWESTQTQSRRPVYPACQPVTYTEHQGSERSSGHWTKSHSCNLLHTELSYLLCCLRSHATSPSQGIIFIFTSYGPKAVPLWEIKIILN